MKRSKRRIKRRGHCPWCSADIRLTRYGRPFHQHTRGAACRAARAAMTAAKTCTCGHGKKEHADDLYECSAFIEDAEVPCLCERFEAAPVSRPAEEPKR